MSSARLDVAVIARAMCAAVAAVLLACTAALTLPGAALARTDTITYSSGEHTFVVPPWAGASLTVVAVGGRGGNAAGGCCDGAGGHGAHVQATLPITAG